MRGIIARLVRMVKSQMILRESEPNIWAHMAMSLALRSEGYRDMIGLL